MKDKLFGLIILGCILMLPNSVSAAGTLQDKIDAAASGDTIVLDKDYTENVEVPYGKTLTIDLASYTLTSTRGTVLFNRGDLTIKGNGKLAASTGYGIVNHGTMVIESGTFLGVDSGSLIDNGYSNYYSGKKDSGYVANEGIENPKLTINNGLFDGGMNTVKNDDNAILVINDGTFQNTYQVSILNWNIATINGGTFNVPSGNDKTTICNGSYGANSVDKGILNINGGEFNAVYAIEFNSASPNVTKNEEGIVTITNGNFANTTSLVNNGVSTAGKAPIEVTGGTFPEDDQTVQIPENMEFVENNGSFVLAYKAANYDTVEALVEMANDIDKNMYTEESYNNLMNAVNSVDYTKNITEQDLVDEMATAIENALNALEEAAADYTEVDALVEIANSLNANDFTKESYDNLMNVINNIDYDKKISEQDLVDEMAKTIEQAINDLVAAPKENKKANTINNPKTSDNILFVLLTLMLSLTAMILTGKKIRA